MKLEDDWQDAAQRPEPARPKGTPLSRSMRAALVRLCASHEISSDLRAAIEREIAQSDALIGSIPASEWMKQSNLA